jgi:O-succinylbenzoate synthase
VCLKPARLGGVGQALAVVESCRADGIPLWMGGMFESGYARGVNTSLAALPGFSWPGDLSPARSYLATDLVAPPELTQRAETAALVARPPTGPGMGESPNLDTVVRLATQHLQITLR